MSTVSSTEALGAIALRSTECTVWQTTPAVARHEMSSLQRGGRAGDGATRCEPPQALAEVPSLEEASSQFHALDRSGFDGERAEWQPAHVTMRSDEAGSRALPQTDGREQAGSRTQQNVPPKDVVDPFL